MLSLFKKLRPGPADSFWYSSVVGRTASGEKVDEAVAMTYSAVWACTRLLASSGACLPLKLFEQTNRTRQVAGTHRVHELIFDSPNDEMSSTTFRAMGIGQQVNAGNFYAEIERVGSRVSKLWPIHHTRVSACRADAELARELGIPERSLAWEVKNDTGHPPTYIPDQDMFHVMSTVSDNGVVGKGVVTQARESIGFGIATEKQGAAYMQNSARPSLVIVGGKFQDNQQREEYRRMWVEVHGGAANNGRPAMLPPEADVKQLSFSPEDSQFLQTRQHNIEEVARWYGVPPHMIGHLLRSTFNNIETQSIEFVVYSLVPWLKMWEDEIRRKLLTPQERQGFRFFAKHSVEGLLRGDSKSRAEFYTALWGLGVLSVNDILAKEDMNPIGDEGDKRFVPMNFTTLQRAGEPDEVEVGTSGNVLRWGENRLRAELSERLDRHEELITRLATFMESNSPLDLVQGAIDRIQFHAGHNGKAGHLEDKRADVVESAASQLVGETWARMLTKETTALTRAASKSPDEFFGWFGEFYDRHELTARDAMRRPVSIWLLAAGVDQVSEDIVSAYVTERLTSHREAILAATEVPRDDWPTFPAKIGEIVSLWPGLDAESWQKHTQPQEALA